MDAPRASAKSLPQTLVDGLAERAARARVPLYASVELTWRCNFRCVHCYQDGLRDSHRELSTAEWKGLLDELADLGSLFLTITGGDALSRPDFKEIYRHAVGRGFLVTVFTNGALVDDALLDLWSELPPKSIEITLYGASAESYERVVGRGSWYEKSFAAVDQILARGLALELKAPLMRPLLEDLPALRAFALARGLPLRTEGSIFPRLDGNPAPLAHRLSPAELVEIERTSPGFQERIEICFAGSAQDLGDRVYRCGAGSNSLNVNPSGQLEPCVISRGAVASTRGVGVASAWAELAPEAARTHALPDGEGCGSCGARGGCSRCPGLSWMETRDVERRVAHHCGVTLQKLKILGRAA